MAIKYASGAEIASAEEINVFLNASVNGVVQRGTTGGIPRTGAGYFECLSFNPASAAYFTLLAVSTDEDRYYSFYIRVPNLPSGDGIIFHHGPWLVKLTTAGKVILYNTNLGTQVGADPAETVLVNTWYQVELAIIIDGSQVSTYVELRLNGKFVASSTSSGFVGGSNPEIGWTTTDQGADKTLYLDDIVVFNNSGSVNNSWVGNSRVILMKPTSDGQRGSWTGGAGGTTNLFDAVNNTPPIGVAAETDLTQIESADNSGDNATDEYRGNCGTYTAAGVSTMDTVAAIMTCCVNGEDVSTNTKTGSFGCQSNPAIGYTNFTYGSDGGALGTWPTGWLMSISSLTEVPSVTKESSLILAVRKTDTGTRVGSVCFLGAYVVVQSPPTSLPAPNRVRRNTLLRR